MNAVVMTAFGGPEVLRYGPWNKPTAAANHVVIKVHATSVNPIDWRIRKGEAKMWVRDRPPMILGADVAGEIAECGEGATRFPIGALVYAKLRGDVGGYQEYVSVPESAVALRPSGLSAIEAAALPAGAMTALQALRDVGELKAGQSVLINGASGGVGLFAVQIARVLGAHPTAVCSASATDLVKRMGADDVIDYHSTDFTKLGRRWDVIFDVSATRSLAQCRAALSPKGIYITTISGMGDMLMPLLNPIRSRKGRFVLVNADGNDLDKVRALVDEKKLVPVIDKVFPLAEAAAAQTYAEENRPRGKVVLSVAA